MQINLAENIRTMRKARRMTQGQLAESLGVTPGAVYKWEAGLSQPELAIIIELADLFDTSVDVLLGYAAKDNRRAATAGRLYRCRMEKDRAGLAEAEKALLKYPNDFEVVYNSAVLYRVFGMAETDAALLFRAMELLERAQLLLPQNTDATINETILYSQQAQTLLSLGKADEAVRIWQAHNAGRLYSDQIGQALASDCGRPDEALPFLSDALLTVCASIIRIVMGYINVYLKEENYRAAQDILRWGLGSLAGLKKEAAPCFLDKIHAVLLVCLAFAQKKSEEAPAAISSLRQANALAGQFDAAPDYRPSMLRFITDSQLSGIYDDLGSTAMEGVRKAVQDMDDAEFLTMWEKIDPYEA